jgi:hypothetical protein
MKLLKSTTLFALLFVSTVFGQKAKDVLEDGISMGNSQYILFNKTQKSDVTDKDIEYEILNSNRIGVLKDSLLFLVKGDLVKTYLSPLNPLTFSFESKNELKPDQIDIDVANALKDIVTYVKKYTTIKNNNKMMLSYKNNFFETAEIESTICNPSFDDLNTHFEAIKKSLENDYKKEISKTFQNLKDIDFKKKDNTKTGIDIAKTEFEKYKTNYTTIDSKISEFKEEISKYDCGDNKEVFLIKNMFNQIIKDLISVKKEQYKRVENLKLALKATDEAYDEATSNKICDWCVEIKPNVTLEKGKIAYYALTLKKSGYKLATASDKDASVDEIIAEDSKEITKNTFVFRKFRRFVPEVSSGIAYTNLDFPKYGAVTDDVTGELKVAKIGEDNIKRINITAMINYNYYVDNSDIHPFIQLGAGINTDFPTLFLGTGLRFNAFNGGRFAVSVGFAGSWIKSLDTLSIGDVVKDDSDIEKDIKYEFAQPKLYYGIQFNF